MTLKLTRYLAFGDSMTDGLSAVSRRLSLDPVTSYPSVLRQLFVQRYPTQTIQVYNAGRAGEWAADGQYRLAEECSRYQPEVLLLMEGANDLAALGDRGVDVATAAVEAMVAEAGRRRMVVFLATLPPQVPGAPRATFLHLLPRYNDWMRRIARDRGATLVDVHAAFGSDLSLLSADGLHPTAEGYRVIAQAFAEAIARQLQQKRAGCGAPRAPRTAAGQRVSAPGGDVEKGLPTAILHP
ncbi:MAG: GDSL-type esterase/lipase family protein, partial [Vicinamibacterales bacterium]|nr:GDSL-type esterase/lipase family protein [Vicinamibacterales bacterium]